MSPQAPATDDTWVFIDGEVAPAAAARVPVLDRGFLYGDSVFEVTRTVRAADGGREPLLLAEHLQRLAQSAAALGFLTPAPSLIAEAVRKTIAKVDAPDCYVRIIVTRGAGPIDLDPAAADAPRLVVIAKPLRLPDPRLYRDGADVVTVGERRNAPGHVSAAVKSSNYLSSVMALRAARLQGAYEAVMCDLHGNISEGASSNFFVVHGGTVRTPPLSVGLLPGITRAAVLSLCRDEGVPLVESPFGVEEILSSDEAFLTSSIRGILPVTRCNAQPIGDGKPGPLTRRLMARYDERHLSTRR